MAISYDDYVNSRKKKKKQPKVNLGSSNKKTTPKVNLGSNINLPSTNHQENLARITNLGGKPTAGKSNTREELTKPKRNDKWLQTPDAFKDGYDMWDVSKTILGTTADIGLGVGKGIFRIGEGIGDLVTYGEAQVLDWAGKDDLADNLRAEAQRSLADDWLNPIEDTIAKNSVIGDKGDSIAEGLGYVAGLIGTGGTASGLALKTGKSLNQAGKIATAITTGTTFTSSMGSSMSEAYRGGATDGEAWTYGTIGGLAEAGTELMFGGLGKAVKVTGLSHGVSSLDDQLAKKVSSVFKSTLSKNLAEYGIKVGAEGFEEVASGVIQALGQKLTYASEKDLTKLLDDQDLLEQFITGAVVSGIAQAPSLVTSTKAGESFVQTEEQLEEEAKKRAYQYQVREQDSEFKKATLESTNGVMNDTKNSRELMDALVSMAEDRQMPYKVTTTKNLLESNYIDEATKKKIRDSYDPKTKKYNLNANGIYEIDNNGKREVLVNVESKKYLEQILVHETAHDFKNGDAVRYKNLQQATLEYARESGELDKIESEVRELYAGQNEDVIQEEITSRLLEDQVGNESFIKSLTSKQPKIVKDIIDKIKYLYKKFTAGSEQAKKLLDLQRKVEKAYKEAYNEQVSDTQAKVNKAVRDKVGDKRVIAPEVKKEAVEVQKKAENKQEDLIPTKQDLDNDTGVSKIKEKYEKAGKVDGSKRSIVLNNGEKLSGTYKLVEAGSVTPSHNSQNFSKSDNFPLTDKGTTINDRDYENDKTAQQLVMEKAQSYDGRAFNDNGVIVSKDGIVVSGNDRTMAGEIASRNNTDKAYVEYLKENAEQFGFTKEQIENMKHPRVVFELDGDVEYSTKTYAKFNKDSKKTKSVSEKAKEIGKTIEDNTIVQIASVFDNYDTIDQVYNSPKASRDLLDLMLNKGLIDNNEISQMYDGTKFTGAGKDLIEATIIGSVVKEDNVKYFRNNNNLKFKLMKSAPAMIQNKTLGEYSIIDEINNAMGVYKEAQQSNMTIEQYNNQVDLFGDTDVDLVTKKIAEILEKKGYKELRNFLDKYNELALSPAKGQVDLFTGEIKTKEEVLNESLNINEDAELERRYSLSNQEDKGYHYGDLGKGGDTYHWNMTSSRRSTGHFGTGTYFFGDLGLETTSMKKENRPLHEVDFSKYNLFKPENSKDANTLHEGLKALNYINNFNSERFEDLQVTLEKYGIKGQQSYEAFVKARDLYYSDKYQNAEYDSKLDSISTFFMKELGFNGIDVRGIEGFDNGSYGSVIYDLDNTDTKYSMSEETDNKGRTLTNEQIKHFKDSKVRDSEGKLITYYNGSGDFTIFDKNKMSDMSKWGKGIYLTKYEDVANMYGDNVKELYVNITNPISQDGKTISFKQYNDLYKSLYDGENAYREEYDMYNNDLDLLWDITNKGSWADYAEQIKEYTGKDGLIINSDTKAEDMVIAFSSNQVKNVDNLNPTDNPDIRYSLSKDNQGRTLSKEQQVYFKDSKVRDENGNLLTLYHTTDADFNEFDVNKFGLNTGGKIKGIYLATKPLGNYGDRVIESYVNITNPVTIDSKNITKEQFAELLKGKVSESNIEGAWRRFQNANDIDILYAIQEQYRRNRNYQNNQEFYDNVKRITGYDGVVYSGNQYYGNGMVGYVAFNSNQIKNVDNQNPTSNPDIRYSLSKDNQGNEVSKGMQEYMVDSKARVDEDVNKPLVAVYHTTTNEINQFDEFNPVGTEHYRFGDQVVNYFTDSKDMSGSYADSEYEMANTKRINNMDEFKEFLDRKLKFSTRTIEFQEDKDGYKLVDNTKKIAHEKAMQYYNEDFTEEERKLIEEINDHNNKIRDLGKEAQNNGDWVKINELIKEIRSTSEEAPEIFEKYQKSVDKISITENYQVRQAFSDIFLKTRNVQTEAEILGNFKTEEELFRNARRTLDKALGIQNAYQYEGYVNITNPYVVDAEGRYWNKVTRVETEEAKKIQEMPQELKTKLTELAKESERIYEEREAKREKYNSAISNLNNFDRKIYDFYYAFEEVDGFYEFINGDFSTPEQVEEFLYRLYTRDLIEEKTWEDYRIVERQTDPKALHIKEEIKEKTKEIREKIKNATIEVDNEVIPIKEFTKELYEIKRNDIQRYFEEKIFKNEDFRKEVEEATGQILKMSYGSKNYSAFNKLFSISYGGYNKERILNHFGKNQSTNDIVHQIIEENKNGANYDGIIIKNVYDYGGEPLDDVKPNNLYITFDSNQFKAHDNENPTDDKDIRYSLSEETDNKGRQLTLEQQERFKNVSKELRDEQGRLKSFYHGSNSNFTIFDINKSGESNKNAKVGFWFTESRQGAENFANSIWYGENEPTTYEVYLNIKNPKIYETKDNSQHIEEINKQLKNIEKNREILKDKYEFGKVSFKFALALNEVYKKPIETILKEKGFNDLQIKEYTKDLNEYNNLYKEIKNLEAEKMNLHYGDAYEQFRTDIYKLAGQTPQDANFGGIGMALHNQNEVMEQFRQNLINEGYDGIVIKNTRYDTDTLGAGNNQYVAFYSNQIKNVDNTNPTDNDDIRYSLSNQNIAPIGTGTLGEDVRLKKDEDVAPIIRAKDPTKESSYVDDFEISGTPVERKPKVEKSKARKLVDDFRTHFVNSYHEVENLAKETNNKRLVPLADMLNSVYGEISSQITFAQTNLKGEEIGKPLKALFQPAKDKGVINEFDDYLKHKLNIERWARNKPVNENITANVSKEYVKMYESKYPDFTKWAEDIYQYNRNLLNMSVEAGLINNVLAKKLTNEIYPSYVPILRDVDVTPYVDDSGNIAPVRVLKHAKGGSNPILSIEESMTKHTMAVRKATRQNLLHQEMYKELRKIRKEKWEHIEDENLDPTDATKYLYVDDSGKYLIAYYNGKARKVKLGDDLYHAMSNDLHSQIKELESKYELITKPLQQVSEWRRNLLTTWSPSFVITNPIMDVQDAVFNSKHTKDMLKNYPGAYVELTKLNTKEVRQFMALYGAGNNFGEYNADDLGKESRIGNNFFVKKLSRANEIVELAPRYAEFKASLQNGDSVEQALYNARDLTTNFSRGGEITKALNRNGVTFLNASVQGFDKLYRNFKGENGAKGYAQLLTKVATIGLLPAILNHLLLDDDEEYQALPDYVKENYYLIKTSEGNFLRIPKGRVLSIFGGVARRTLEYMQGEEDAFKGYGTNAYSRVGVGNPLESNVLSPLIQAYGSENGQAWYGGDLVPTRLQDLPAEEQFDEGTDKASMFLGDLFNTSPYKLNYIIDQYSGGIGDILLPLITDEAQSDGSLLAPLVDKFRVNSTSDNKYVGDFYDTSNKLEVTANGRKASDEDVLKSKYMKAVGGELAQLYKEKREIQSDNSLSKSEKYEKVQSVQREINNLAKQGLDSYENINKTSNYAIVGDREYYKYYDEKEKVDKWGTPSDTDLDALNSLGATIQEKGTFYSSKAVISSIQDEYKPLIDSANDDKKQDLYASRKKEIIEEIKKADLSNSQKAFLYSKYYSSDSKLKVVTKLDIDFNKYLDYESQYFVADKDSRGNTISGSKKNKIFNYLNSTNLGFEEKLILAKLEYKSYNEYNRDIINYLNNSNISYEEEVEILEELGFEVDDQGNIYW